MKPSKQRRKELREIYLKKISKEYIEGLIVQPFVSPREYVEYITGTRS
jgi:hypothetical protein